MKCIMHLLSSPNYKSTYTYVLFHIPMQYAICMHAAPHKYKFIHYLCNVPLTRFTISSSSAKTRSYALRDTQKTIAVTPSKQWIHFFLSDLCPPTSTILQNIQHYHFLQNYWASATILLHACTYRKLRFLWEKFVSTIPVVFTRVLKTSCSVGV